MKYRSLLTAKWAVAVSCVLVAMFATSCSDDYKENPLGEAQLMTGVSLSVSNPLKLALGMDSLVIATPIPEETTFKDITWSSADENIVTVSQEGLLAAKTLGSAYINLSQTQAFSTLTSLRV